MLWPGVGSKNKFPVHAKEFQIQFLAMAVWWKENPITLFNCSLYSIGNQLINCLVYVTWRSFSTHSWYPKRPPFTKQITSLWPCGQQVHASHSNRKLESRLVKAKKLSLRTPPGRKQDVQHTVSLCSIEKWHTVLILTILPQEEARNTEHAFIAKV